MTTDVTNKLLEQDPTLQRHNEGYWTEPYRELGGLFSSFNDAGIECETGEFLYAMVRLLKPFHVLETGTHHAVGASYMGQALLDNGKGKLDTIEFLPEIHARAVERIKQMGLDNVVNCHLGDAKDFFTGQASDPYYDLILLDTEPQTRFAELIKFYPQLIEGGYVFIHDLHRHMHQIPNEEHGFAWPYGPLPEEIKTLVREGKLRPFHFSTPRGLTGFYKPKAEDYQWN